MHKLTGATNRSQANDNEPFNEYIMVMTKIRVIIPLLTMMTFGHLLVFKKLYVITYMYKCAILL